MKYIFSIIFVLALLCQPVDDSWDGRTNNVSYGPVFHEYVLVYTNRYGYVNRLGFDNLKDMAAYIANDKNNVHAYCTYHVKKLFEFKGIQDRIMR